MDPKVFARSSETRNANVYLLFRVPLAFLVIASILGLFLRYQQFNPQEGINYTFLLHGHSHVMFLGWIFNVLLLTFTIEFVEIKWFRVLFWFLQSCVAGMLVSFPLQGYGVFSIVFSSLHTFGTFAFALLFFRATTTKWTLPLMLAKAAILFLILSSLGPFALAYLKSHGLDHSNLYRFAIYFYLHFQYNGFFLFGILSLVAKLSEGRLQQAEHERFQIGCYTLIGACIPAYLLSILWSKPPVVFNIFGFVAGAAQLAGLYIIWKSLKRVIKNQQLTGAKAIFFSISFAALSFKLLLQTISAFPVAAQFANEFRHVVIAYLHLVLVGFTSFFLFGWLLHKRVIPVAVSWEIGMLIAGFIGSEILLAVSPWSESIFNLTTVQLLKAVFLLSLLMAIAVMSMSIRAYRQSPPMQLK